MEVPTCLVEHAEHGEARITEADLPEWEAGGWKRASADRNEHVPVPEPGDRPPDPGPPPLPPDPPPPFGEDNED